MDMPKRVSILLRNHYINENSSTRSEQTDSLNKV